MDNALKFAMGWPLTASLCGCGNETMFISSTKKDRQTFYGLAGMFKYLEWDDKLVLLDESHSRIGVCSSCLCVYVLGYNEKGGWAAFPIPELSDRFAREKLTNVISGL
ncbi:MAG: hypothetical protein A2W25_04220 [candidate division Zixibacteria bacterium RBG_16_53_22]|nr:MAG: hypothetical protein A2W25_04220 [candidate division Zixibacteria bacterium RBG_16_53_22]